MIPLADQQTTLLTVRMKGTNPEGRREPVVKCPICKKILYSVLNTTVRNNTLSYDLRDPQYASLPREYIYRCPRCHNDVGIVHLNTELRRMLGFPLLHEKTNPLKFE